MTTQYFGLCLVKTSLFLLFLFSFGGLNAQSGTITISGTVKDKVGKIPVAYVNVVLKTENGDSFVTGSISNENGIFTLSNIKSGNYSLELSIVGFATHKQTLYVGKLSDFINTGVIELEPNSEMLDEVTITARQQELSAKMDKKVYSMEDNISQSGGSALQAMQNLPGIILQDGKIQLRGNDKIAVLIDDKQTALTGFDSQTGLDNLPASLIERIEIINNPSAKYDANGNAGIINIILKKNRQEGFNGKIGMAAGLGALWERKENLPDIDMRPQYRRTPKINPSLALNYRKNSVNTFLQFDDLYTKTLNVNEFVTRNYADGAVVHQQTKRNRNTNFLTSKAGVDWYIDNSNMLTVSGLYGSEYILDNGDEPFLDNSWQRIRLWKFLEDELKTTVMATASYQHKFKQAGHLLNAGFNYTFHREDEKYFFENILPTSSDNEKHKILSDESVFDWNIDYIRPLKYGRIETGLKFRIRNIPTDMEFTPSGNSSPLDINAGGWATYRETIPALYGSYIFDNPRFEAEIGLRVEYVNVHYDVNPDHSTYKSDGYNYMQPFPNIRLSYKINEQNKLSLFFNRRVDRPNEVDIRIFPKYDDAEIIKVGNPALHPQFTNTFEFGHKTSWNNGSVYAAVYHKISDGTITRISTIVPASANPNLIYAIFQNVNKSYNSGFETVLNHTFGKLYSLNLNANVYRNQIDAFTVENLYPVPHRFSADTETMISGNIKLNQVFHLPQKTDIQCAAIYLAPDIIPQGKIHARFTLNLGIKKTIQNGRGELLLNVSDMFNTLVEKKEILGNGFNYVSTSYKETQVARIEYNYKF